MMSSSSSVSAEVRYCCPNHKNRMSDFTLDKHTICMFDEVLLNFGRSNQGKFYASVSVDCAESGFLSLVQSAAGSCFFLCLSLLYLWLRLPLILSCLLERILIFGFRVRVQVNLLRCVFLSQNQWSLPVKKGYCN